MKNMKFPIGIAVYISCLSLGYPVQCDTSTEQAISIVQKLPYASTINPNTYVTSAYKDSDGVRCILVIVGDRMYQVDQATGLVSSISSNKDESGQAKYPISIDELHTVRPDLPYDRMPVSVGFSNYTEYAFKYPDGSFDRNVSYHTDYDASGQMLYVSIRNNPIGEPLVSPKISKDRASFIGLAASRQYKLPTDDGQYMEFGHARITGIIGPMLDRDISGDIAPVYIIYSRISANDDFETVVAPNDRDISSSFTTVVSAVNGEVLSYNFSSDIGSMKQGKTVPAPASSLLQIQLNQKPLLFHQPSILQNHSAIIPMNLAKALAKGNVITAKANTKAFSLDGKQVALDAKVLNRKGMLYLPWQALNSLPGVKAQFDAKQAKLDITTTPIAAAATK